jgi:uncharacterized FlaG/YvyC family protein
MEIAPLTGPPGVGPTAPRPDELKRTAAVGSTIAVSTPRPSPTAQTPEAVPPVQAGAELEQLRKLVADEQLELHLQSLPDSSVVLMRIVDPHTGDVVREFPPEGLAEALAELRKQAAAHFDQQA